MLYEVITYPLIQGYIFAIAVAYVVINIAVDILYKFFDPRVDIG